MLLDEEINKVNKGLLNLGILKSTIDCVIDLVSNYEPPQKQRDRKVHLINENLILTINNNYLINSETSVDSVVAANIINPSSEILEQNLLNNPDTTLIYYQRN